MRLVAALYARIDSCAYVSYNNDRSYIGRWTVIMGQQAADVLAQQVHAVVETARASAKPQEAWKRVARELVESGGEPAADAIIEALRLLPGTAARDFIRREARDHLMNEPALTSEDVSKLLGSKAANTRQYAMELRQRGELLGLEVGNRYLYPEFQFDRDRMAVHDVVKDVAKLLSADTDPWGVLSWWVSPNARLPGHQTPRDLLQDRSRHGDLLELAEAVVEDSG